MSNEEKHQIWCYFGVEKFIIDNNEELSALLTKLLRHHHKRQIYKYVAHNLDINMYVSRNWFQKNTGITFIFVTGISAYHLILLMREYDFIKEIVDEMVTQRE